MALNAAALDAFEAKLPELLPEHAGQYVVMQDGQVLAFQPTYERALSWAYDRLGLAPFFVKQVLADAPVAHFTRDLGPCAS
jgi:hypothetical protein